MKGRAYERIRCPGCQQLIAAYIPHGSDGRDLRLVVHGSGRRCAASDRRVVLARGRWTVAA